MNDTEEKTMAAIKSQLDRIESSTRRTEQAVFGDKAIGLNGLVNDVNDLKQEKQNNAIKVAGIAGLVSGVMMGGKAVLAKIFGAT